MDTSSRRPRLYGGLTVKAGVYGSQVFKWVLVQIHLPVYPGCHDYWQDMTRTGYPFLIIFSVQRCVKNHMEQSSHISCLTGGVNIMRLKKVKWKQHLPRKIVNQNQWHIPGGTARLVLGLERCSGSDNPRFPIQFSYLVCASNRWDYHTLNQECGSLFPRCGFIAWENDHFPWHLVCSYWYKGYFSP